MIKIVKKELVKYVEKVLDDTVVREIKRIVVEMYTNKGETFKYYFDTKNEAIKFLEAFEDEFDEKQFISIFQHSVR